MLAAFLHSVAMAMLVDLICIPNNSTFVCKFLAQIRPHSLAVFHLVMFL